MKRWFRSASWWAGAALAALLCWPAHAALVLNNGGFETGLAGWTTVNLFDFPGGGSGSFFLQTGTTSPVLGETVPAPPDGLFAAMTDAEGPGSHVLFQDFIVPASPVGTTFLSFDLFIGNRAEAFHTPNHLDFSETDVIGALTLNQQARVDILDGLTDPFSLAASDVVLNAFRTNVGDPLVSGYTNFQVDVTSLLNANLNTTLRLRFAEVDNVAPFQFGIDNVAFVTPAAPPGQAPEPGTLALLLGSAVAACFCTRRRRYFR
jgi:hypothetical protein